MPPTSAWLPNAAKPEDILKALTRGTDCMSPHASQASSQSGAVPWTTDTNTASGSVEDHGGPAWR